MMQILVLCGKSCSGKDTLANELIKKFGYEKLVTYTTRPIRKDEIQGKTYHFISTQHFLVKMINNEFLEVNFFNVADGGIWFYGSAILDYEDTSKEKICILDPNGVKAIRKHKIPCTVIYVDVDDDTILNRQLERNDDKEEAARRFLADKRDFEDIMQYVDFAVTNKKYIYEVANEINLIHKNWRRQE